MTNQSNLKVMAAINIALTETRCAAIEECENAIWEQFNQYEKLLDSEEGKVIFGNAYGEKFQALYDARLKLRSKMMLLITIASKINEVKWQKQEEKEN